MTYDLMSNKYITSLLLINAKCIHKVNINSLYLLIHVFLYTLLQVQQQSNLIYLKLSEFVFYP